MTGWLGWVLFVATLFGIFPLVEREREMMALLLVGVSAALLWLVTGFNLFLAVLAHPAFAFAGLVAYFGVGFLWSRYVKWRDYLNKTFEATVGAQQDFIRSWIRSLTGHVKSLETRSSSGIIEWKGMPKGTPEEELALKKKVLAELETGKIPDELVSEWLENSLARPITLLQNKERILNWILFWPWSALSYFCFDLLKRLLDEIWLRVKALYQSDLDRKYAELDQRLIKKSMFE